MLKTVRISEASWRSYGRAFKRFESVINLNRKLDISTAPTKAKSLEAAYSQALVDKKIDRGVRIRQSDGYGGWSLS